MQDPSDMAGSRDVQLGLGLPIRMEQMARSLLVWCGKCQPRGKLEFGNGINRVHHIRPCSCVWDSSYDCELEWPGEGRPALGTLTVLVQTSGYVT